MVTQKIVYGIHAVRMILDKNPETIVAVFIQENRVDLRIQNIIQLAQKHHTIVRFVPSAQLRELSQTSKHQGIIARLENAVASSESNLDLLLSELKKPVFLLILDGVQDPHNLGACLRTADAAGVQAVIIPKDNAVGLTPVVRKVACGAADTVPLIQVTNLAREMRKLQEAGVWLVGADERGEQTIFETDLKGPIAIVMGAEGKGLRRLTKEHCDFLVRIPMHGVLSSLNVSVATGICLFEAVRQKSL